MDPITPEQLHEELRTRVGGMWNYRDCSLCDAHLHYIIVGEDDILLDTNCHCTRFYEPPAQENASTLLELFNMQTPEARERMWESFLETEPDAERAMRWA